MGWVGCACAHGGRGRAGCGEAVSCGRLRVPPVSRRRRSRGCERLPAPVRVAYEAGPTGYGLARACAAAGIACTVAAPSKIPRAPGDRVKTDRRDAERLARLLRLGELVAVRVPEPHEEAARDLVRAREDARGDLMRARHRLSKLLLRHGLVYDASAWTLAHDAWLRRQRFASRPLALAFDECYGGGAAGEGAPRRARRARSPSSRTSRRSPRSSAGSCCLRGVVDADRARADGRARRLAALPAAVARPVPGPDAERGLDRRAAPPGRDHEDRQHARPPVARRGGLAPAAAAARQRRARAAPARPARRGTRSRRPQRPPPAPTLARARAARQAAHDRRGRGRARARRHTAGRWRRCRSRSPSTARRGERTGAQDARSDPRYSYEQPAPGDARP